MKGTVACVNPWRSVTGTPSQCWAQDKTSPSCLRAFALATPSAGSVPLVQRALLIAEARALSLTPVSSEPPVYPSTPELWGPGACLPASLRSAC